MTPKVSVVIPTFNHEHTINDSLVSIRDQEFKDIEIVVINDGSTDSTITQVRRFKALNNIDIRIYHNHNNMGIGHSLTRGMDEARGKYVVYLCSDDVFADTHVIGDIVNIFETLQEIAVIGHYFYQFIDGHEGAVTVSRNTDIISASCNPSGMAFRKGRYTASQKTFIEMPSMVKQAIKKGLWTTIEYDTVAVRVESGVNTAHNEKYYKDSPVENWTEVTGKPFSYYPMFIQFKNRCPKILWREICNVVRINPKCLLNASFWFCSLLALSVPSLILKRLSNFYRHRIARRFVKIIRRSS